MTQEDSRKNPQLPEGFRPPTTLSLEVKGRDHLVPSEQRLDSTSTEG